MAVTAHFSRFRGILTLLVLLTMVGASMVVPGGWAFGSIVTARGSGLVARVTYTGTYPVVKDLRLTITRSGQRVYDARVRSKFCGIECTPVGLRVARLQPGAADIVLSLYTGGAHCCYVDQVFTRGAGGVYRVSEHDFGDPGSRLRVFAGYAYPQFLTADDAFAYAFTDYAASGLPVRVLRFRAGSFVNVTRRYPMLIRSDARLWMGAFRAQAGQHYADSTGLIAAWAADEVELGRLHLVTSFLAREAAAGHLNSGLSPITPSGKKFVSALMTFLRRHHYLHA